MRNNCDIDQNPGRHGDLNSSTGARHIRSTCRVHRLPDGTQVGLAKGAEGNERQGKPKHPSHLVDVHP